LGVPDRPLKQLLSTAFHEGPAVEANLLINAVRKRIHAETGKAINYEVPLMGKDWSHVMQTVAPRLALYLREKRLGPGSASVFISIFWEDTLYFVGPADFFACVQAALGLDDEAFASVFEMWERTGKAAAGLLE